jgi:6-pyruvoyltetrahydropterin/6-carboxytetrahydropterin synthase
VPTVYFTRTFQAAHRLSGHLGKCSRIHGHNFALEVEIETDELGDDGFVVEFDYVKQLVDEYDHRLILKDGDPVADHLPADWVVLVPDDPSTEFMAGYLADQLATLVRLKNSDGGEVYVEVTLRETDSIAASGCAEL